jgi:O-antigen/teichoic acid export membrane protein
MEVSRRTVRAAGFLLAQGWPLSSWPSKADFAELAHFNVVTLAMRLIIQIDGAIPRLFLGLVSASALGYFNFAQRIFAQLNAVFIAPFNGVALPLASRIQGEPKKLHAALDGAGKVATLIAYPVFLGAAAIAPVAIPLLLGHAWAPATVCVQLMLMLGMRAATASVNGGVMRAIGRPGLQLGIVFLGVVIIACFTPLVARWGADAVAMVYLARGLVTWVISAVLIERFIGYPATRQFLIGCENFVCAVIMAAAVSFAHIALGAILSGPTLLAALILIGAAAFMLALCIFSPATISLFKQMLVALYKRDRHRAAALAYEWARSPR